MPTTRDVVADTELGVFGSSALDASGGILDGIVGIAAEELGGLYCCNGKRGTFGVGIAGVFNRGLTPVAACRACIAKEITSVSEFAVANLTSVRDTDLSVNVSVTLPPIRYGFAGLPSVEINAMPPPAEVLATPNNAKLALDSVDTLLLPANGSTPNNFPNANESTLAWGTIIAILALTLPDLTNFIVQ